MPRDQAMAFAVERPTSSAPIRPGPRVTPMRSMSRHLGTRLGECLADDRADELEVAARGDLRDDAAVAGVEVGLRGDDGGEHPAVPRDDRSGGLVARRLDAQDHPVSSRAPASTRRRSDSRHMITASSRLSV